jgi:serine/threonine protein kinase
MTWWRRLRIGGRDGAPHVIANYGCDEIIADAGPRAVLYRARDRSGAAVALKALDRDVLTDDIRRRILSTNEVLGATGIPNIVPIREVGEQDRFLFIVSSLVAATDLGKLLGSGDILSIDRVIQLMTHVADALDAAHVRGLVHGNLKPSNVLLASGERAGVSDDVYLTDFGLARTPSGRGFAGSADYAAPEQIEGGEVSVRTDVYAFGALIFHCLVREVPFPRPTALETLWAHVNEAPPRPSLRKRDLPPAIDGVIKTAMAKAPGDRFASCGELVHELGGACPGLTAPVPRRETVAPAHTATETTSTETAQCNAPSASREEQAATTFQMTGIGFLWSFSLATALYLLGSRVAGV